MSEKAREMICISCPLGCHMTVTPLGGEDVKVEGNRCPRGVVYGREEVLSPKRVVTATAALSGGVVGRVPVKTDGPLLKELIPSLLEELYAMKIKAPVKQGLYLIENYRDTGVSLVTTRTIPAACKQ